MELMTANQKDCEACVELLLDLIDVTGEHIDRAARKVFDSLLKRLLGQVIVAADDGELLRMMSLWQWAKAVSVARWKKWSSIRRHADAR